MRLLSGIMPAEQRRRAKVARQRQRCRTNAIKAPLGHSASGIIGVKNNEHLTALFFTAELLATSLLGKHAMRKAGGNWVVGDKFFDRETELEALTGRVQEGSHTLLTAQRRMGKTSLVRELLRRLKDSGQCETIFVDLDSAITPADAVAEIAFQSRAALGKWSRFRELFANIRPPNTEIGARIPGADVKMKLPANVDVGNWQHKGDRIFAALARGNHQIALALDELPMLVNRLLEGNDHRITPEGKRTAGEFLSWLRKNGQEHRGKISIILSGSMSLEPILQRAGLSAHVNIFPAFDLKPWDEETAMACLAALAKTYGLDLPIAVREEMCRRLRCQIPHHVQHFFDLLHLHLRRARRSTASAEDIGQVYEEEMLGVRGQREMAHYEERMKKVLADDEYRVALEMLTEAAVSGGWLSADAIARQRELQASEANPVQIEDVLNVLEHDGYLARQDDGYCFISGLLEDWWRVRYGHSRASSAPPRSAPR